MDLYASDRTKYDVPLSHLDYGYIEDCTDGKELEKIYKILRTGYEGSYPDLERLAESKLQTIKPDSKALRKEMPVSTKRDLPKNEQNAMDADLSSWADEMRCQDDNLQQASGQEVTDDKLPPVRGASTNIPISKKSAEEKERKERRVKPREYSEWDKIDIDDELAKIDGEKPKPAKNRSSGNEKDIPVTIETSDLTDAEKTLKANREKDKGNEAFRAGDYEEALVYYKRSIQVLPIVAAYNNRAQTYLKMKKWTEAYKDCNKVLDLEPNNLKALLRRAVSSQGSKDYIMSKNDLLTVLHTEPNNKRAQKVLEEVEKSLTEQKVKGRRMVIEEVEGSDSSDDEEQETQKSKINGHATQEQLTKHELPKSHEQSVKPKISEISQTNVAKDTKLNEHAAKSNGKETESNGKDIWTEEDLIEQPTYTANIPINQDGTNEGEPKGKTQHFKSKDDFDSSGVGHDMSPGDITSSAKEHVSAKLPEKETANQQKEENTPEPEEDKMEPTPECVKEVRVEQAPLPADCAALKDRGNQLYKKGQYPEATGFYDKVINKLLRLGASQEYNLSVLYCNRATSRHKMGNCSGSIEDCNSALELQPTSIKALARRAMAYETTEKYRLAYVDFRQVLLLDSSVEIAQQGSTRCTQHLREQDGPRWREKLPAVIPVIAPSISMIQNQTGSSSNPQAPDKAPVKSQKVAEKPANTEQLFEKCKCEGNDFVKKGEYKLAIDRYSKCIEYCPGSVPAYTNRALCYLKTKQPKHVIEDCTVALSVEGDNVKALFRRALAYKEMRQYEESVNDLKHLIKVDSKNAAARKEFATILREKQEYEVQQKQATNKPRQRIQIQEVEGSDSSDDETTTSIHKTQSNASKQATFSGKSERNDPISKQKVDATLKTHTETFSLPDEGKVAGKTQKRKGNSDKREKVTTKSNAHDKGAKATERSVKSDTGVSKDDVKPKKTVPVLGKTSPYEFMHAWTSLKSTQNTELYAELLKQVPPKDLKTVISNNLEGDMLTILTKCVRIISDQGAPEKALQYMMNLPKVTRFSMVSMFMSDQDKKDVSSVVQDLKTSLGAVFTTDQLNYVNKQYKL